MNQNMDFLLYEKGESFLLNGVSQRGLFIEVKDKISFYDDIILTSKIPFETGDSISYQDSNWLVISQVQNNHDADVSIYRSRIRKCNYDVNFNFDGLVKTFPTIIEGKVFDVQSGQYIMLPTGKILVTIQENPDTLAMIINQRFIKMGSAWKVIGIDRSKRGLIILSADLDPFAADDDKIKEIANVVLYTVAFSDTAPIEVNIGSTYQTTIIMQKDGTSVTFPSTYSSSAANIMSVDANGLLIANMEGSAVITVAKSDNPSVSATINVTAKINHVPVVANTISPQTTSMLQTETVNYSVYQYVDSVANSDTFTITASGPTTTYYILTIVDGNHFNIYNKQYTTTKLVVTCTNNRDASSTSISITLKGLW